MNLRSKLFFGYAVLAVACSVYSEDLLEPDGTGGNQSSSSTSSSSSTGTGGSSSSSSTGTGGSSSSSTSTSSSTGTGGSSSSSSSSSASSSSTGTGGGGGALTTIYETSFEAGQPAFEKVSGSGIFSNVPPAGTTARNGSQVITNSTVTTSYTGREIQSVDCIALLNDTANVIGTIYGEASNLNGGNSIYGRIVMLWFTDETCTAPHATTASSAGSGLVLPEGSYLPVTFDGNPPDGATHFKVRFEVHDNNGGSNLEDDWAADDVTVAQ